MCHSCGKRRCCCGKRGPQGPVGATGAKGDKGADGDAGATGAKGEAGADGAVGATGPKGDKGEAGEAGSVGATGAKGVDGATGAKGDTGATGVKGADGAAGAKGDKGDTGATGVKGDTGQKGDTGATGVLGCAPVTDHFDPETDFFLIQRGEPCSTFAVHKDFAPNSSPIWENAYRSVVAVVTANGSGFDLTDLSQGSAWTFRLVGNRMLMVTSAHVVVGDNNAYKDLIEVIVIDANGVAGQKVQVRCNVLGVDRAADVGVLISRNLADDPDGGFDFDANQAVLQWGNSDTSKPGSYLAILGFPFGQDVVSFADGTVRDNKLLFQNGSRLAVEQLYTNAITIGGNSGGPILDANGKVIGLLSFGNSANVGFGGGANQYFAEKLVDKIIANAGDLTGQSLPFAKGYLGISVYEAVAPLDLLQLRQFFPAYAASGVDLPIGIVIINLDNSNPLVVPNSRVINAVPTPLQVLDIITNIESTVLPIESYQVGLLPDQFHHGRVSYLRQPTEAVLVTFIRPTDPVPTPMVSTVILDQWPAADDTINFQQPSIAKSRFATK